MPERCQSVATTPTITVSVRTLCMAPVLRATGADGRGVPGRHFERTSDRYGRLHPQGPRVWLRTCTVYGVFSWCVCITSMCLSTHWGRLHARLTCDMCRAVSDQ